MKRAVLMLALGLTTLCGCSGEPSPMDSEPSLQRAESSARLWLREVQHAHALADRAESAEARRDAAALLTTLARTAPPEGLDPTETIPTRQDLYGRAAELCAKLGEPRRALELLTEGLALGETPTPFLTQLVIQTADVKAALSDAKGAEEARELARRLVQ